MNTLSNPFAQIRRFRQVLRSCTLCGIAAALVACGGGGDGGDGSGQNAGGDVPSTALPDKHTASLDAIIAAYGALPQTDPTADAVAMLEVVRKLPDVRRAGIQAPGSVWLNFSDGISAVVSTIPVVGRSDLATPSVGKSAAAQGRVRALDTTLPGASGGARHAYLSDAVTKDVLVNQGVLLDSPLARIKGAFERQGFQVTSTADVDPGAYEFNDASVLYMRAHGGIGITQHDDIVFVLSTNVAPDDASLKHFKAAIDADEMGYMVAPRLTANGVKGKAYASLYITPKFVRNHMKFTDGSLVFLDACSSFAGAEALEMRNAFRFANASIIFGWTADVEVHYGADSAVFLFDRLLAGNDAPGYDVKPPNRPFNVSEVYHHMEKHPHADRVYAVGTQLFPVVPLTLAPPALYFEPQTPNPLANAFTAKLDYEVTKGYEGFALAPAINGLNLQNLTDHLTVFGTFGGGPAKGGGTREVTLDGKALTVESWNSSVIVLKDVPRSGTGSNGQLVVNVDGAHSNPAWIDQWNGVVLTNYEPASGTGNGAGTATTAVQCTVDLRGSSSVFRSEPDGPSILPSSTDDAVVQDGTCSFDAYGTYDAPDYTLTYAPSGSKALPWLPPAQRNALASFNRYAWVAAYISEQQLQFQLFGGIRPADGGGVLQTTILKSNGASAAAVVPLDTTGATATGTGATFGADDSILGGQVQQTLNLLTWNGVAPAQAGDPNHAR